MQAEDDGSEAHSWWACKLVCGAMGRPPPLVSIPTMKADAVSLLLTPCQSSALGIEAAPFSSEYVYRISDLASAKDRIFRKACRRMSAVVAEQALELQIVFGASVSKELVGGCMHCRNLWERRRAASGASSGAKRSYFLRALLDKCLLPDGQPNPDLALLAITRREGGSGKVSGAEANQSVLGYLLTERVRLTIVAVDGVHDYTVTDPRADPSAWLLQAASRWWSGEPPLVPIIANGSRAVREKPPVWLNDGPIPTAGLLNLRLAGCSQAFETVVDEIDCAWQRMWLLEPWWLLDLVSISIAPHLAKRIVDRPEGHRRIKPQSKHVR